MGTDLLPYIMYTYSHHATSACVMQSKVEANPMTGCKVERADGDEAS